MEDMSSYFFHMLYLAKMVHDSPRLKKEWPSFGSIPLDEDAFYELSLELAVSIFEDTSNYYNAESGIETWVLSDPAVDRFCELCTRLETEKGLEEGVNPYRRNAEQMIHESFRLNSYSYDYGWRLSPGDRGRHCILFFSDDDFYGARGEPGADGSPGQPGSDGESAYAYAVAGGYTGTEDEFKEMLAGGPWIPSSGRIRAEGCEAFNDIQSIQTTGYNLHVEGSTNVVYGDCAHVEGRDHEIKVHDAPFQLEDLQYFMNGAHIEGAWHTLDIGTSLTTNGIHVEGVSNNIYSYFQGEPFDTDALEMEGAHVEGSGNKVYGAGVCGHIGGFGNKVALFNVNAGHITGYQNDIKLLGNSVGGYGLYVSGVQNTLISGDSTYFSEGMYMLGSANTINKNQFFQDPVVILGMANNPDQMDGLVIVGGGDHTGPNAYSHANCFRITRTQVFGGTYKSSGADYAELFEWIDGNPDNEDRAGRFVTLDGDKLRLAGPSDEFVLGIVSGNPSIVGDVHDDQWHGMYQKDIFGRYIQEDVEVPAEIEEVPDPKNPGQNVTMVKRPAHTERRLVVNPDYNPDQEYTPRSERREWGAVGMMGKLVAIDDGTCQVNGWCAVGDKGVATFSAQRTSWRTMARLDADHVLVLAL